MSKKYYRTVISTPSRKIVEKWKPILEQGLGENQILNAVANTLQGREPFFRVTTRSGAIEVIPPDILSKSHVRIEYGRFGF